MLSISNNKYEPPCKSKPRLIFLFKNNLNDVYPSSYSTSQFRSLLQGELNVNRPIIYVGYSDDGGHAWNIDGYDGDYFHNNWGYDTDFVNDRIEYFHSNIDEFNIANFKKITKEISRSNKDIKYSVIKDEIIRVAQEVIEADGITHENEELMIGYFKNEL